MAFQTPTTIKQALKSIETGEFVLPAIQRELVWPHAKIERLFDSLMRGYPIGSFLFWSVDPEHIEQYKFYDFMLDYHERDNPHCAAHGAVTHSKITAVLDGQQRLTAMNIGLRGSYAYKLPRLWWKSSEAFPTRHLYLNVLDEAEENEAGMRYDFRFLTRKEAERRDETHCWYRASQILTTREAFDLHDFLIDRQLGDQRSPFRILGRLHKAIHLAPTIAYYKEESQDLEKVLDIFIRTNSGGTPLSHSDMLMSMATAQWESLDAREAIHGTVDEINRIGDGFRFSKDFLLKAGLLLAGVSSVGFKITNFNRRNMKGLEERWDSITQAVRLTVELIAGFGFSQGSLSANNAVLPIAYYLYRRGTPAGFQFQGAYREDRSAIRSWLLRSLLKRGVWGSGLDTLLTALRSAIDEHGNEAFPSAQLEEAMRKRGKGLTFEEEELEDLVESKKRTFALLAVLYPFVNVQRNKFHIDHIFPKSRFSTKRLREVGVCEDAIPEFRDRADRLPNLQLLVDRENEGKGDKLPEQWIRETFDAEEAEQLIRHHDLGDVPADMTGFSTFYERRRDRLLSRLKSLLGPDGRELPTM